MMTVGALPRGGAAGGLRFDIGKAARKALAVGIDQRPGDSDLIRESVRRLVGYQDTSTSTSRISWHRWGWPKAQPASPR